MIQAVPRGGKALCVAMHVHATLYTSQYTRLHRLEHVPLTDSRFWKAVGDWCFQPGLAALTSPVECCGQSGFDSCICDVRIARREFNVKKTNHESPIQHY